ncbi:hypothetical protein OG896_21280 [Streptomyces sp. NBC_00669]|uniref:hypothetical protein n=1 Tax=Streptomyces sp. NBC_00669 TaxID=2976011 RepID=UPI002E2F3938|nr:hypothetical protein [Streptomyces sp. NBC_00669]
MRCIPASTISAANRSTKVITSGSVPIGRAGTSAAASPYARLICAAAVALTAGLAGVRRRDLGGG